MLTPKYIDGHWEVFEDSVWGKSKEEEVIAEREKEKKE